MRTSWLPPTARMHSTPRLSSVEGKHIRERKGLQRHKVRRQQRVEMAYYGVGWGWPNEAQVARSVGKVCW